MIERPIEKSDHIPLLQCANPVRIGIQLSCSVDSANQCTNRATSDIADLEVMVFQAADRPDVGQPPGPAAAKNQGNTLFSHVLDCTVIRIRGDSPKIIIVNAVVLDSLSHNSTI